MNNLKLKILTTVYLITFLFSSLNIAYSQINSICADTSDISSADLIPKRSPASGQFYRVLILYVAFSDDTVGGPDWNIWPQFSKPNNPYTSDHRLIDTSEMSNYTDYTYSKWFQEMSRDSFDFIGNEILVNLPNPASYYEGLHYNYGDMNNVVLHRVDSLIDFSRYDNWKYVGGHWEWGTDGNVDFVIMNYRNIPDDALWFFNSHSIGGIATIGTSTTLDGKFIGTGVTALGLLNRLTRTQVIVLHEVCHYFFGHTSLGLMTPAHSQSTYHMSPHEREDIGYIQPTIISSSSSSQSFTLRDYIKYGDCLKIQIPNTSPAEYFYVANHQKKSKYDGLARGSNTCWTTNRAEQDPYCDKNKGLYIYHSSGGCSNNFGREVDLENAEGKFDWQVDYSVTVSELGGSTPILSTVTGNPGGGREEYGKQVISGTYSPVLINDDPCSSNHSDYSITWDDKGDEMDAYNIGYDEIFSPYSNPASNSCANPTSNSGLTFDLVSQDTSGSVVVKIFFNNDSSLIQLPPSKTKNVKVVKSFFGGTGSVSFHPKVTWDQNTEPDFNTSTAGPLGVIPVYEIYRGHSSDCGAVPDYSLLTSVSSSTTMFIDSALTLYDPDNNPLNCNFNMTTYSYKIVAKDNRGNRSLKSERGLIRGYANSCSEAEGENYLSIPGLPKEYSLRQNYPNPFNPVTSIHYELPIDNFVTLKIYDAVGREIITLVNEFKNAGTYDASFNGSNLPSGAYFYKIMSGNFTQIRKMILIK